MYKLTQAPQIKKISPREAEEWLLKFNNFEGQRPMNQHKSRRYADMMAARTMRPISIAFMTLPDGSKSLGNGQHGLQAICILGKEFTAIIEDYKCESRNDAWHLFATFDVHATRSEGQVMKAARGLFDKPELNGLPLRFLTLCGSALYILGDGDNPQFHASTPVKTVKPELVERHSDEVAWASLFLDASHLARVHVVAAMLSTYRANQEHAWRFWGKVKSGENVNGNIRRFRDTLIQNILPTQDNELKKASQYKRNKYWYSLCIAWWNSYMSGEERLCVRLGLMTNTPSPKKQFSSDK